MPAKALLGECCRLPGKPALMPLLAVVVVVLPDGFPFLMVRAFLLPMAVGLAVYSVFNLLRRAWSVGVGSGLAAVVLLAPVVGAVDASAGECGGAAIITVAQVNVQQENDRYAEVAARILEVQADVVVAQEADTRWVGALRGALGETYPWHLQADGERFYSMAVFSRTPPVSAEVVDLGGLPAMDLLFEGREGPLRLFCVHLRAPESSAKTQQRNRQWRLLEDLVSDATVPVAVVGDLNTVPWDGAFRRFVGRTQAIGRGVRPTWPAFPGGGLVPLDHVIGANGAVVCKLGTFPIPGSDHRGVGAIVGRRH